MSRVNKYVNWYNVVDMATAKTTTPKKSTIASIEEATDSKVIVYVTGDRALFSSMPVPFDISTVVAPDVIPHFKSILSSDHKKSERITLIIYTNGGMIETPWPLVNLIRDYCSEFEVIVLEKSLSAGTLIALGADKIIMPKGSYLSPIDPARTIASKQNADNPQPQGPIPKKIEIEDIIGFIDFAKDKVGINDQRTLGEILKELSAEVDPSTIGSINRTHSLIRRLAHKLLSLHNQTLPEHQAKELVEQLTEKLFSHSHLISLREAREIGFGKLVDEPSSSLETLLNTLFEEVVERLSLKEPLNLDDIVNNKAEILSAEGYRETIIGAVIYSEKKKYEFQSELVLKGMDGPQGRQVNINLLSQQWKETK